MIRFLLKGLLRDKHRSLVPILVVASGVMLAVVFQAWILGIMSDSIEFNARFTSGHVKVMTRAYAENSDQMPNDLAITGADSVVSSLKTTFPDLDWVERIHFAGLVDVPDSNEETKAQAPAIGFGLDLLSGDPAEKERLNIIKALTRGRLPEKEGEILLSEEFSRKLGINPGDRISLISTTMFGEMSVYNLVLSGTVIFGSTVLDKGTLIADIRDTRKALNMENACGEILGFFKTGYYDDEAAGKVADRFNASVIHQEDEFLPVMKILKEMNNMRVFVEYASKLMGILLLVFMTAMSIVLWNAGLLGGLRRYGEYGMRLAIGEEKNHVYKTMIYESLLVGVIGSVIGVLIGMAFAWYLQAYGINFNMMKNATIMMPTVFRARISTLTWFIGFIPGVGSTLIGTMLSGIGIYKRQTAQLFKELES
jgi:putative ABC transport system permease protein